MLKSEQKETNSHEEIPKYHQDPFIRFLHRAIRHSLKVLAILMVFVIIWGIGDVVYIEAFPTIVEANNRKLEKFNKENNRNYTCLQALLWKTSGESKTIKMFNNHTFASVFGINEKVWPWSGIKDVGTWDHTLETVTLDKLLKDNNVNTSQYPLLCIDVQGAEYEVLLGATELLPHIKCMKLEVSKKEFYKGQTVYKDLKSHLENLGFTVDEPTRDHDNVCAYRDGGEQYKKYL